MKKMSKSEFEELPVMLQEEIAASFARYPGKTHYNVKHEGNCWGSVADEKIDDLYEHEYIGTVCREDIAEETEEMKKHLGI